MLSNFDRPRAVKPQNMCNYAVFFFLHSVLSRWKVQFISSSEKGRTSRNLRVQISGKTLNNEKKRTEHRWRVGHKSVNKKKPRQHPLLLDSIGSFVQVKQCHTITARCPKRNGKRCYNSIGLATSSRVGSTRKFPKNKNNLTRKSLPRWLLLPQYFIVVWTTIVRLPR